MSISTDLSNSPYYDDFDPNKKFAKVLFRPGVGVQTRELNQMQSILQAQIERMGDNIFKKGTIISGCQFVYYDNLSYIKLKDSDVNSETYQIADMKGKVVHSDSTGLDAYVIDFAQGYESSDPDLKTLYLRYTNAGTNGSVNAYANNEVLTISDFDKKIFSVKPTVGSSGLSNNDTLVFTSALEVQNSTGGILHSNGTPLYDIFFNEIGNTITQATTGAVAKVLTVNSTANSSSLIISIKPLANNLANSHNSSAWTFNSGYNITGGNTSITANVSGLVGSGAVGSVETDGSGAIVETSLTSAGSGYYYPPVASVAAANNKGSVSAISTAAFDVRNYLAKVAVAQVSNSAGQAYSLGVTDGVVYQKGYFLKVDPQTIIVSKYNTRPDGVAVGFQTSESFSNTNTDSTLFDNASGALNFGAPGADRLVLTPTLKLLTKEQAAANDSFLTLVEWSEGYPFRKSLDTQYATLGEEISRRTKDGSGNFVLNQFNLITKGQTNVSSDSNTFIVTIDTGLAYIDGRRVESVGNYNVANQKGIDTQDLINQSLDVDYGNYIRVKELAGYFPFQLGAIIDLRDTAKTYITSGPLTPFAAAGNSIGSARIRSWVQEQGTSGTSQAIYRLYLFDIQMSSGKNFRDVKSVYSNSTNPGVADLILEYDASTGQNIAVLKDSKIRKAIFKTGIDSVKTLSAANLVYDVRTSSNNITANSTGFLSVSLSGSSYFPYSGVLTDQQKQEIIVVPLANTFYANIAGSVSITSGQTNVTGTSTTLSVLNSGDYIRIANSTAFEIKQVGSITNNTFLTLTSATSNGFTGANLSLAFPQNVPIPLANRSDRVANVTSNTVLTISLGNSITTSVNCAIAYNKRVSQVSNTVIKTAKRLNYVKIQANTNLAGTTGPWALGIPDVFRLRGVYSAQSTSLTTSANNITNEFYIDHNQQEDYLGIAYLYKKSNSSYSIANNDVLLVEFDTFTQSSNGIVTIDSYPIDNTKSLANADALATSSTINILELPEFNDDEGNYYDLRDCVDFRLRSSNTANVSNTAAGATINPIEPTYNDRFDLTTDKNFLNPQSDVLFSAEAYQGRVDRISISSNGDFFITKGIPGSSEAPPKQPSSLDIEILQIPAYPSVPSVLSSNLAIIADTKMSNEKFTKNRLAKHRITSTYTDSDRNQIQPKAYHMEDIGSLERRIENIESQLALTIAENELKTRPIPSSSNTAIPRHLFGFFIDDFKTTDFSDFENPEYNALIRDGNLYPPSVKINLPFEVLSSNTELTTLPYVEYNAINQPSATDGPIDGDGTDDNPPLPRAEYVGVFVEKNPLNLVYTSKVSETSIRVPQTIRVKYKKGFLGLWPKYRDVIQYVDQTQYQFQYVLAEQKLTFKVSGVKPNTIHQFYWNDENRTSKCRHLETGQAELKSNSLGIIDFEFYLDSFTGSGLTYSSFIEANNEKNMQAKTFKIRVSNESDSRAFDLMTCVSEPLTDQNPSNIDPTETNSGWVRLADWRFNDTENDGVRGYEARWLQ